jgi:hypothetical protein
MRWLISVTLMDVPMLAVVLWAVAQGTMQIPSGAAPSPI